MMNNDLVRIVNFPESNSEFKIIQLYVDDEPVMICQRPDGPYMHGYILQEFLEEEGIEYDTFSPKGESVKLPQPEGRDPKGRTYRICGMGHASVWGKTHFALPDGASVDYNISPDETFNDILEQIIRADPVWDFG